MKMNNEIFPNQYNAPMHENIAVMLTLSRKVKTLECNLIVWPVAKVPLHLFLRILR
jgi:hypothetical protein